MKPLIPAATAIMAGVIGLAALSACSVPERSRNLNDASIAPAVTALQVCSNCHGAKGVSTSPNFPNLAAQPAGYIEKQLHEFREPGRADPEGYQYMWGLSKHLTDDQIKGLAEYFSKQPAPPGNVDQVGTADMKAQGRKIFEQGIEAEAVPACFSCHGAHAEGNGEFPRLAGQHADYLMKQLNVFQNTNQRPAGVMMMAVAHNLSAANIESIAVYLESMPPAAQ